MRTVHELAEMIDEQEKTQAYGSETNLLSAFVAEYDYVGAILDGNTDIGDDLIKDDVFKAWQDAYADQLQKDNA